MEEYFESESYLKVDFWVRRLKTNSARDFGWTLLSEWRKTKQGAKMDGIQTYNNFFNAPPSTYYSLEINGYSSVYNKSNGKLIRDENGKQIQYSDWIWLHFR